MPNDHHRAFTLVELLVVVGVIAVMAAILFPVHPRPRRGTLQKSSCQNNLKQIALGFKQYNNDYDDHYPLVITSGRSSGNALYGWADTIQPYIKNTQVYQCPSDTNEGIEDLAKGNHCDYWYNANFMVFEKGKWTGTPQSMLAIPSQTVMVGDGGNTTGTATGDARYNQCGDGKSLTTSGQVCHHSSPGLATYPAAQIHVDGSNFAFADGHVKWYKAINPTQNEQVLNNGITKADITNKTNRGKFTFSLLAK